MTTITKQVIHTLNTHINTVVPNPLIDCRLRTARQLGYDPRET